MERHEAAKAECDALGTEIAEFTSAVKKLEKDKQKLDGERVDLNHKLEKHTENVRETENGLRHYAGQLAALKLHDIDELANGCSNPTAAETTGDDESTLNGPQLRKFDAESLKQVDKDELKKEIDELEAELKKQSPNLNAIQNYKELVGLFVLIRRYFSKNNLW